jgi:hypothetical protein
MNSNPVENAIAKKALIILLLMACSCARLIAQTVSTNQPSGTFPNPGPIIPPPQWQSRPGDFDFVEGWDSTWAAEKHLLSLFRAEGFPRTRYVTTNIFERASDGAKVNYTYVPATWYTKPAEYRLSASWNPPGMDLLHSAAGKMSADRLAAMNEAVQEFKTNKKPVIGQHGDFTICGDFRVKVDENTVELDGLWKGKGI